MDQYNYDYNIATSLSYKSRWAWEESMIWGQDAATMPPWTPQVMVTPSLEFACQRFPKQWLEYRVIENSTGAEFIWCSLQLLIEFLVGSFQQHGMRLSDIEGPRKPTGGATIGVVHFNQTKLNPGTLSWWPQSRLTQPSPFQEGLQKDVESMT